MYRKIMGFLEAWKESEHRKPFILQGRKTGRKDLFHFGVRAHPL